MRDFRIEVRVDHDNRDEAIAHFLSIVEGLKDKQWKDECMGGGGGVPRVGFYIYVGARPLSIDERLARLEGKL